jgi:hypothetical protein
MAQWHLTELRDALQRKGWRFDAELPGDDYRISATWRFVRSGRGPNELLIDFDGLDDTVTLPIFESYACQARGTPHSLYFRRRGDNDPPARGRWVDDLSRFVTAVGG